ncbi:MAG: SMP-30/gluconolactonase/LRE family protein [Leptolyngbyaceae cyanobacterium SM1_1_3]|nr:SMP-30/gluconolactonase/LRE family protein [Leptolyngbyaceae cyanobacterium SM1_1_3]NJN01625.1 SMP-30/gluconolactonase/LRE family protein [Leptolyngbyaceae cyanobacterium RM1_1_2]NJO09868.1 SMP-30/gluconolactonase/LRE family protein [Leptolyngbyaceae cyanobacterium SL_1_1]
MAQQCLYWVDIYNHWVYQFDPATGQTRYFDVGGVVGCLAIASNRRLLLALRHELAVLDLATGELTPILSVEADKPYNRFNDGKCDVAGRFWFGSMSTQDAGGSLYRYDLDGSLHQMATGLTISNGIGWSPDNQTFYLTDSADQVIYAYQFDLVSGAIAQQQVLVDLSLADLIPDGLAIDAEGCLWSAIWDGWCVIRFSPEGKELARFPLPVQRPTACTFGGTDLKKLYVTTASVGLSEAEIQASVFSGDLFCIHTDVVGLPTSTFAGALN